MEIKEILLLFRDSGRDTPVTTLYKHISVYSVPCFSVVRSLRGFFLTKLVP